MDLSGEPLAPIGCCTPSGCVVEGFCGLVALSGEPFCAARFGNVDPAPFGGEPFGKVDPADGSSAASAALAAATRCERTWARASLPRLAACIVVAAANCSFVDCTCAPAPLRKTASRCMQRC